MMLFSVLLFVGCGEEVDSKITELEGLISELSNKIDDLENQVSNLEENNQELLQQNDQFASRLNDLEEQNQAEVVTEDTLTKEIYDCPMNEPYCFGKQGDEVISSHLFDEDGNLVTDVPEEATIRRYIVIR